MGLFYLPQDRDQKQPHVHRLKGLKVPQNTANLLGIERLLTCLAQLQRVRRFIALRVVSVTTSGRLGIICLAMCLCVSPCGKEFKKVKRVRFS